MKRASGRRHGRSAFDLVEEAVYLLRTAPVAALAAYYVGSIPFVLGLLFYWADMSRSPFAGQHLADASLGMAILFFWMKFWQVLFARRLRAQAAAQPLPVLSFRRVTRTLVAQMILQPLGLFLIPLSLLPVIPFPWVYAFYQNVAVLADGERRTAVLFKKSCRQAGLWPTQNGVALGILFGFAACVFINWSVFCMALPQLCKMLFGIQSVYTKSPWSLLNTTFLAAMGGLTYLCVDPLLKAFYVLRCFYGEAVESGEDLKAELKPWVAATQKIAAMLAVAAAVFLAAPSMATEAAAPAPQPAPAPMSPGDLDQSLNRTIHERKYTWRMPREQVQKPADEGMVARFFDKVGDLLRKWTRAVLDWLDDWMQKLFHRQHRAAGRDANWDWGAPVQLLLWCLVAMVAATLGVFLYRIWRDRHQTRAAVASEAVAPAPDLANENVGADQLPEDSWTRLGRELLARGEFRLAMRAFYLASLSHLASRNLIRIARSKSNREYERELQRRGHSFPDLLPVFSGNVALFERVWYGMHEVDSAVVHQFAADVERLKSA